MNKNSVVMMNNYKNRIEEFEVRNDVLYDCIWAIIKKEINAMDKKFDFLANKLIEAGILEENFLNEVDISNEEEIDENIKFIYETLNLYSNTIFTELNDLFEELQWVKYNSEVMLMDLEEEINERLEYL